jgi:tRNA (guanine37-N1)-methyltransferase
VWHIELLTIFPKIFDSFLSTSLVEKATDRGLFSPTVTDIRDFADPPHYKVDDSPYGGGAGMVMLAEPLVRAIEAAKARKPGARVVLFSPAGQRLTQRKCHELSAVESLIFVLCRYEGVDQRVIELAVDEELSIGDFVVMGGEVPAMLTIEACLRLRPQVLHNAESIIQESFSLASGDELSIEAPQYSRPEVFRGLHVPEVLLSGNHKAIANYRQAESRRRSELRKGER